MNKHIEDAFYFVISDEARTHSYYLSDQAIEAMVVRLAHIVDGNFEEK